MFDLIDSIKSIESVLDVAIWLEKRGKDFYENAVSSVRNNDEIKTMLLFLIEQEKKHEAMYKSLSKKITGNPTLQDELFGEYGMFIRLLISEITESMKFDHSMSLDQLIQTAIQFEKDTLLYFHEIKKLFTEKDSIAIQTICDEERNHIRLLMDARKSI
jgi:rubrerythrin